MLFRWLLQECKSAVVAVARMCIIFLFFLLTFLPFLLLLWPFERCCVVLEILLRDFFSIKNGFGSCSVVPSVCYIQINGIVYCVLIPHSVPWVDYTPQICGTSNRRLLKWGGGVTLEQCKQLCPGCAAIEYWSAELHGGDKTCWECLDHTKRHSHMGTYDLSYPPHVYVRQWTTPSTRTATKVAAEP